MELLNTLYVTLPDSRLRLDNETLRVDVDQETRLRVPLHHLHAVVCFGHVGLSAPLMHRLAEAGIALVLLDGNGRFKARLEGETSGNVLLRGAREAKLPGDEAALTRAGQDLAASLRALPEARDLDQLRGIEGEAARTYFAAINLLVRPDLREHFQMDGRSRRPPRDRMNALLSFLYSMWMNDCRSACETAGLDPQIGFLHAVRPGRAALALDLIEEFRPQADRLALTLINRGQLTTDDFAAREGGAVSLEGDSRKAVVVAFQERKKDEITHPLLAQPIPLGLGRVNTTGLLTR
jgi:CRISPR-associated protein Cas1